MFGHVVSVIKDNTCERNSGEKTPVKPQIYDGQGDGWTIQLYGFTEIVTRTVWIVLS